MEALNNQTDSALKLLESLLVLKRQSQKGGKDCHQRWSCNLATVVNNRLEKYLTDTEDSLSNIMNRLANLEGGGDCRVDVVFRRAKRIHILLKLLQSVESWNGGGNVE